MSSLKTQSRGRFIAVVGSSGAGKDSVMAGLCARVPELHAVRRVITRAPNTGGEAFDAVTPAEFAARTDAGAFALHWTAHGLSYGIPVGTAGILARGQDVLVNLSRGVVAVAAQVFGTVVILHVTAPSAVLSHRLSARGREDSADATRRLTRPAPAMPEDLPLIEVDNSGPLDRSIDVALSALYPDRA